MSSNNLTSSSLIQNISIMEKTNIDNLGAYALAPNEMLMPETEQQSGLNNTAPVVNNTNNRNSNSVTSFHSLIILIEQTTRELCNNY